MQYCQKKKKKKDDLVIRSPALRGQGIHSLLGEWRPSEETQKPLLLSTFHGVPCSRGAVPRRTECQSTPYAMALLGSRRSAGCEEDPPSKMLIKNLLLFLIKTHRFHILGFIFSSSAVKSVSLKWTLLSVFTSASGIKSINLL